MATVSSQVGWVHIVTSNPRTVLLVVLEGLVSLHCVHSYPGCLPLLLLHWLPPRLLVFAHARLVSSWLVCLQFMGSSIMGMPRMLLLQILLTNGGLEPMHLQPVRVASCRWACTLRQLQLLH